MDWLPVAERVKQFVAVSVYKFSNKLAPIYMDDIFIKSGNTRRTRYTDKSKLLIPFRNHEYGKICLTYFGVTIWNSIDNAIKEAKTCNNFKHKVKNKYFKDIKQKEDDIYKY